MSQNANNLIWIDLEMTGLDTQRDHIIEIATIVTDSELNILAQGPVLAIYQADEVLDKMDSWNKKHHTASGLIERVQNSQHSAVMAEKATLEFLREYISAGKSPMCGNSICQDRRFLYREMPELEKYFHYRNLDVSTIKELARRWAPEVAEKVKKESLHIALQDIQDSIDELRYYRQHLFTC